MTNEEMIEQLEQAIGLIKQDGKDWLDDRDIPIIEACIKSLTALDKIRAEINAYTDSQGFINISEYRFNNILDKYKGQ